MFIMHGTLDCFGFICLPLYAWFSPLYYSLIFKYFSIATQYIALKYTGGHPDF